MAEFSNKIQNIYPGITSSKYSPDKTGSSFGNALEAVGKGGTEFIDTFITGNERRISKETDQAATDLIDNYLEGSPSEYNYLKGQQDFLSKQIESAPENDKVNFQNQLEDVNSRLLKANQQGALTPFEFSRRLAKVNQDLVQNNPGYADVVTRKMAEKLQMSGISDVLKRDESYFASINAQNAKIQEQKDSILISYYGMEALNYPTEVKEQLVNKASLIEAQTKQYTALKSKSAAITEYDKQQMHESIMAQGGYGQFQSSVFNSTYEEIKQILNLTQDPIQRKNAIMPLIAKSRIDVNNLLMSTVSDPSITAFKENMGTILGGLETWAEGEISLETLDKYKKNYYSIQQTDFNVENGTIAINAFLNNARVYNEIKRDYGLDSALFSNYTQYMTDLGKKIQTNIPPEYQTVLNTKIKDSNVYDISQGRLDSQINTMARDGQNDINDLSMYGNHKINHINVLNNLPDSPEKFKRIDRALKSMTIPNQEVFDSLYERPEFRTQITEMLNTVNQYSLIRIEKYKRLNPTSDLNIYFDADRGQVRSDNKVLDTELQTINNYIKLRGKIAKKDPTVIAKDIISSNFGTLDVFGIGQGNGSTVKGFE